MQRVFVRCALGVSLSIVVLLSLAVRLQADELPIVAPADVGMSAEKLAKVDDAMLDLVEKKRLAGGIVMIVRQGKVAKLQPYGMMDIEAAKPMRNDAIFRIYSMTKAVATAAALTLVDDGKLKIDDPVSKYIPEFKSVKVLKDGERVTPDREIIVADLMRHTAGLTYGVFGNTEVDQAYRAADVLDHKSTLKDMVVKLGKLPLAYSPGKGWAYSVSVDVLGRVVEIASGKKLDDYMQERIFTPLDMKDTGFFVPKEKLDRYAQVYVSNGQGKLSVGGNRGGADFSKPRAFLSGGGGLTSTIRDYMRFLVMIRNGGELFGKRVLSKDSVRLMTTNQLPKEAGWVRFGPLVRRGVGFGLGFSVRVRNSVWDPAGRIGEYGWGGMASTHYWASPKDDLIVVTMEQTLPYSFMTEFAVKRLIYDAIEN